MNKSRKKASYGMPKQKMRGGDYMEPNKELQFGGLKRDPDKETYYGGPNTKAGRITKRAENKKGRIGSRDFGKRVKNQAKEDGMSNRAARIKGRGARKAYKATHTHSRVNQTIGEKDKKAEGILKKSKEKYTKVQDNADARKKGKQLVKSARTVSKMKKGGPKKAMAGAAVQAGGAALQGIGKLTDAIAGKETKFGKIAGAVGQTAGAVGGMMGGIPGNPAGAAMNAVGQGQAQAAPPAPAAPGATPPAPATPPATPNADATAPVDPNAPKQVKKGGRRKLGGKKMKYKTGGAKPDYLDMDKDGNKTESMKSALKDRRQKGGVRTSSKRGKRSLRYTEMDTDSKRAPLRRGVKTRQTGINEDGVARKTVVKSVDGATGEVRKQVFMRDDTRRGKKSMTGEVKDKSRFVNRKKTNKKLARISAKQDRMDRRK